MNRPTNQPYNPASPKAERPPMSERGCAWLCIGFVVLAALALALLLVRALGIDSTAFL